MMHHTTQTFTIIQSLNTKMFQNKKMCITENKANQKFTTESYFSKENFISPNFPNIKSKFPDNSLFFSKKESIFKFPDNSLISLISRLAVNPDKLSTPL